MEKLSRNLQHLETFKLAQWIMIAVQLLLERRIWLPWQPLQTVKKAYFHHGYALRDHSLLISEVALLFSLIFYSDYLNTNLCNIWKCGGVSPEGKSSWCSLFSNFLTASLEEWYHNSLGALKHWTLSWALEKINAVGIEHRKKWLFWRG